jgi:uncharacterized protein YkwD
MRAWVFLPVLVCVCCGASHGPSAPSPAVAAASGADRAALRADSPSRANPPLATSVTLKSLMSIAEARRYMVELINHDRASAGLPPVTLDEGPPTRAAQLHAEDMAENGYLGHWGLDGSVPEERYTNAGGTQMVLENASCFTDGTRRALDARPGIDPAQIEHTESMFFNEVPPNDGHRKNLLKPWHKKVGIGIAQPRATPTEIPVPCVAQELVDDYGVYSEAPKVAHMGERLHVAGRMSPPAQPIGVGLARVDFPQPITAAVANSRRSYAVPQPYQMYWPAGYQTPIPVVVNGPSLSIDVPLGEGQKPGLYELSIWAKLPQSPDFQVVSLRTIRVVAR